MVSVDRGSILASFEWVDVRIKHLEDSHSFSRLYTRHDQVGVQAMRGGMEHLHLDRDIVP